MKIFLTSDSFISVRDENGVKIGTKLDQSNAFASNLKKLTGKGNFVFVCNDPVNFEWNDNSSQRMFDCLKENKFNLKECVVLDNRNKKRSKEILLSAGLIFLQGGQLERQYKFLKQIKFKKWAKKTSAVIVGKSAGAMNLCKIKYNYPDEDYVPGMKKWLRGLGFSENIIIPHFNLINGNEYCPENINLLQEHFIPDSHKKDLLALTNGAYILQVDGKETLFGQAYVIRGGKITEICKGGKRKNLNKK